MPSFDFRFKYRGSHTCSDPKYSWHPRPLSHGSFLRLSNLASSPQSEIALVGTWLPSCPPLLGPFAGLAHRCRNSWKRMRLGKPWRQMRIPSRTPLQRSWSSTRRGSSFPACRGDGKGQWWPPGTPQVGSWQVSTTDPYPSLSLRDSRKELHC